jgi:hypothetical protein
MAGNGNDTAGRIRIVLNDDTDPAVLEILERLMASAAGLPHVCVLKRCRRRKRCLGPPVRRVLPCKRHHRGLARARFESALAVLGWPNCDEDGNPIDRK